MFSISNRSRDRDDLLILALRNMVIFQDTQDGRRAKRCFICELYEIQNHPDLVSVTILPHTGENSHQRKDMEVDFPPHPTALIFSHLAMEASDKRRGVVDITEFDLMCFDRSTACFAGGSGDGIRCAVLLARRGRRARRCCRHIADSLCSLYAQQ